MPILVQRNSVFQCDKVKNINPSHLSREILSSSYTNERQPNRLTLFDINTSKIRRKSILNQAKNITDKWLLSQNLFKNRNLLANLYEYIKPNICP